MAFISDPYPIAIYEDYRSRLACAAARGHPGAAAVLASLPGSSHVHCGSPLCTYCSRPRPVTALAVPPGTVATFQVDYAAPPELPPRSPHVPTPIPPGVNITGKQRIGDKKKDASLWHLGEALAQGFIDKGEYDARSAAALAAKTGEELDVLVKDLPSLTTPAVVPAKEARPFPFRPLPMGLAALTSGTTLGFLSPGALVLAVFLLFMIFGVSFLALRR